MLDILSPCSCLSIWSKILFSSIITSPCTGFPKLGLSIFTADPAAALPAAAPKTKHSVREVLASLLAPFMLTHATSQSAYTDGIPDDPCMYVGYELLTHRW